MNKILNFIGGAILTGIVIVLAFMALAGTANAQSPSFWYPNDDNNLQPVDDSFGLQVPGLSEGCLQVAANGTFTTTGDPCGSGSGGGDVNGSGVAGSIAVWIDENTIAASSSPTVGYIVATSTTGTTTLQKVSIQGVAEFLADIIGDTNFAGQVTFDTNYPLGPNTVPTLDAQLVDKAYADGLQAGFLYKSPVQMATTSNVTLSGEQTIDGTLTSNSRILLLGQSNASQNGCYVTAAGAWSRCADYNTSGEVIQGTTFLVLNGATEEGTAWALLTTGATLGTTDLEFIQVAKPSDIDCNDGLVKVGNTCSVDYDDLTIGIIGGKLAVKNGSISLTTKVTGVLPEANGGTDQSTYTAGDILYSNTANNLAKLGIGTSGQVLTVTGGLPAWQDATGGGGTATTSFGATTVPWDFISSAVTNQAMGVAPSGDQEFGSTVSASSTISRRFANLQRGEAFYLEANQQANGVAGQTLRVQCSSDGISWSEAGDSNGYLNIQTAATPRPKSSNWTSLSSECKSDVIRLRLMGNGGNGVANPTFKSISMHVRYTQPAAGEAVETSVPLSFLSVTTAQAFTNMVAATTTRADRFFDATNATEFRLTKNQTILANTAPNAKVWLECSADGVSYTEATTDANRYLSIFAVGQATTTWMELKPACKTRAAFRLLSAGGVGAASDPAFTDLSAQFNTTEIALGGGGTDSNWEINGGYLTPTSTIPVLFNAPVYASSSVTIDGNVGIASSSPSKKLSVVGDTYLRGSSEIPLIIQNSTASTTKCEFDSRIFLGVVTGMNISCQASNGSYGTGVDQELAVFGRSSSSFPQISFAANWANISEGSGSIRYATGTEDEIQVTAVTGGFRVFVENALTNSIRLTKQVLTGGLGTLDFPYIEFNTPGGLLSEKFGGFVGGLGILESAADGSDPVIAFIPLNALDTGGIGTIEYSTSTGSFIFKASAATSTKLMIGSVDDAIPGCIGIADSDANGWTYLTTLAGVLSATTTPCE